MAVYLCRRLQSGLSVRFGDRMRWWILTPKVLYCDFSVGEYLENFKMAVTSMLYEMAQDGFSSTETDDEFRTEFEAELENRRNFEMLLEKVVQEEKTLV